MNKILRSNQYSTFVYAVVIALLLLLTVLPLFEYSYMTERLTVLFIYIILAAMWNTLAGFGGLISIGQQLFFGLGAYFTIRLANSGISPFIAIFGASLIVTLVSLPISKLILKLKAGEFAIGMWVLASIGHLLVNLDPLIQGETGTSLISLNEFTIETRRLLVYYSSLFSLVALLFGLFLLLRSKAGLAMQSIRDNEEAADSLGVNPERVKIAFFVFAALGTALAGALWLSTTSSFQPKTYFSVQWTAYMIFMVLVGGLGKFEGAILGALIFFAVETWFSTYGVWYLVGLGAIALFCSLFFPKGLWGLIEGRYKLPLFQVGHVVSKEYLNFKK